MRKKRYMPAISIINKCQLNCKYCFAKDIIKTSKTKEEISIENFKYVLDFLKTGNSEQPLKLVGGEPMLHSRFLEIIDIVKNDKYFNNVMIFTNGLDLDKYIDLINDSKFCLLINCNSYMDIGKTKFEKLMNNIKLLNKYNINFELGINLYYLGMDYSYIFDLLKLTKNKNLRFSVAVSNSEKEETQLVLESYLEFKPFLIKFFNDCVDNEIVPYFDCNSIPFCLLNIEDKKVFLKLDRLAKKLKVISTITTARKCNSPITIFPDLTAIRCYSQASLCNVNIKNFKDIYSLENYFNNKIDVYEDEILISPKCKKCENDVKNKCGICPAYKNKEIREIISK